MGDNIEIIECKTHKERKDFLDFPKKIYNNEYCPQDYKTEKQLLDGNHPLSSDFKIIPMLAYQVAYDTNEVLARCIITLYENDDNAYIGLYESIDNTYVYTKFLHTVENKCRELGKKTMVGPVDASFWIKYRFKIDSDRPFKSTYTGEPYNKQSYLRMWKEVGFEIDNIYNSNLYREVTEKDSSEKCKLRVRQMEAKGYKIENSSFREFDKDIRDIHRLITKLYSKFPIYKDISFEQFKKMFGYLKYVLNYNMIWVVKKDNEIVAFFICVPNYSELDKEKSTFKRIIKMLKIRKHPKEYVMLYMGVDNKHLGLGSALAEKTKEELNKCKATSIGALIQEGKTTNIYYKNLIVGKTTYVTLRKSIS